MKILVLCDEGNNRSVMVAHHLKYWGHDVIPAGVKRNSPATLQMLSEWADKIIVTELRQIPEIEATWSTNFTPKIDIWNIGPDNYPRPFNKDLLAIVRKLMDQKKATYKF